MSLVVARCTQCGAELQVDNSQEAAVCKYCGTPFIVEKAINNYNAYINNDFNGANVTLNNRVEQEFEHLHSKLRYYLETRDYKKLGNVYEEIVKEFPYKKSEVLDSAKKELDSTYYKELLFKIVYEVVKRITNDFDSKVWVHMICTGNSILEVGKSWKKVRDYLVTYPIGKTYYDCYKKISDDSLDQFEHDIYALALAYSPDFYAFKAALDGYIEEYDKNFNHEYVASSPKQDEPSQQLITNRNGKETFKEYIVPAVIAIVAVFILFSAV